MCPPAPPPGLAYRKPHISDSPYGETSIPGRRLLNRYGRFLGRLSADRYGDRYGRTRRDALRHRHVHLIEPRKSGSKTTERYRRLHAADHHDRGLFGRGEIGPRRRRTALGLIVDRTEAIQEQLCHAAAFGRIGSGDYFKILVESVRRRMKEGRTIVSERHSYHIAGFVFEKDDFQLCGSLP